LAHKLRCLVRGDATGNTQYDLFPLNRHDGTFG
jgi:hypothetical protein